MGYKIQNAVIMRSPLLSLEDSPLENNININQILNEYPYLKEAIAISISNSNSDLLLDIQKGNLSQKEMVTLYKYWMRSSIRSTPYGLFAGISNCYLKGNTEIVKDNILACKKKCCVDYEWFYAVVQILESCIDILENCKIKINSQCYLSSDRIINPYVSNYGRIDSSDKEVATKNRIKNTFPVQLVMKYALDWIGYRELKEKIFEHYNDIDDITITKFLFELLKNEYIITNLRGVLECNDPLQKLIDQIGGYTLGEKSKKIIKRLIYINELRKEYENMELGQGIDKYLELCKKMEEVYPCKSYVNIITYMPLIKNSLSLNIKESVDEFLEFLNVFATEDNQSPAIEAFKTKFIERYGIYVEVPIFDLLDESIGLGNPYRRYENKLDETNQRKSIKKFIKNKIDICIKKNERTVLITDEDIQILKEHNNENVLRLSKGFELNLVIYCNEDNKYEFRVTPSFGSSGIGRLTNRFYNILSENTKKELEKYIDEIINDDNDCIYADSSFLPRRGRNNNICNGHRNYDFSIDSGLDSINNQIELSDILVGYNEKSDRLYLRSKKKGKIVNVFSDSMLNRMVDNYYFRFMWEVSYAYQIHPIENLIGLNNYWDLKYIPEIKVKNVVIQPETWKLNEYDFPDIKTFDSFFHRFIKIKKDLKIPDRFVFIDFDHYLAIDVYNVFGLKLFYTEVKKNIKMKKSVEIQRFEQKGLIVSDTKQKKYFGEFVFECINEDKEKMMDFPMCEMTHSNILDNKLISSEKRIGIGEAGWFYFKIYIEREKANSILIDSIYPFIKKSIEVEEIYQFFYLRYSDPHFHIRLRINTNERNLLKFIDLLNDYISKNKIRSYSIEIYEREIERYGGDSAFKIVEQQFYYDSLLALEYLEKEDNKEIDTFKECAFGIISVYGVLYAFTKDTIEEEGFLNKVIDHKEFHEEYRKKRTDYYNFFTENVIKRSEQSFFFQNRQKLLEEYANEIKEIDRQGKLTNSKTDIILSVIHMFCNRYNGEKVWERKIIAFVRHLLHDYNSKMRYLDKLNNSKESRND